MPAFGYDVDEMQGEEDGANDRMSNLRMKFDQYDKVSTESFSVMLR